MANCENYKVTLMNSTHAEIKVTKLEYKDGSNWKTETGIFGADGHQKIEEKHGFTWTRDLEGISNENTQFRVTYQHHIGGTKWGDDIRAVTGVFKALDNESRTVTLTA
jgi:hypothetical protein